MDIICEIGVNHESSLDQAISMVEELGAIVRATGVPLTAKFLSY